MSEKFICNVTVPINSQNITLGKLSRWTALPFVISYFSNALRTVGGIAGCFGKVLGGGVDWNSFSMRTGLQLISCMSGILSLLGGELIRLYRPQIHV